MSVDSSPRWPVCSTLQPSWLCMPQLQQHVLYCSVVAGRCAQPTLHDMVSALQASRMQPSWAADGAQQKAGTGPSSRVGHASELSERGAAHKSTAISHDVKADHISLPTPAVCASPTQLPKRSSRRPAGGATTSAVPTLTARMRAAVHENAASASASGSLAGRLQPSTRQPCSLRRPGASGVEELGDMKLLPSHSIALPVRSGLCSLNPVRTKPSAQLAQQDAAAPATHSHDDGRDNPCASPLHGSVQKAITSLRASAGQDLPDPVTPTSGTITRNETHADGHEGAPAFQQLPRTGSTPSAHGYKPAAHTTVRPRSPLKGVQSALGCSQPNTPPASLAHTVSKPAPHKVCASGSDAAAEACVAGCNTEAGCDSSSADLATCLLQAAIASGRAWLLHKRSLLQADGHGDMNRALEHEAAVLLQSVMAGVAATQ